MFSSFLFANLGSAPTYYSYDGIIYKYSYSDGYSGNLYSTTPILSIAPYFLGFYGSTLKLGEVGDPSYGPVTSGTLKTPAGVTLRPYPSPNQAKTNYTHFYTPLAVNDCLPPNEIVNGECVNNVPTCNASQHLDSATDTCVANFPLTLDTMLDGGMRMLIYEDGTCMFIHPDGKANTYNADMQKVAPRYLPDGSLPPEKSVLGDLWDKTVESVGDTMQVLGWNLIYSSEGSPEYGFYRDENLKLGFSEVMPIAFPSGFAISLGRKLSGPITDVLIEPVPNSHPNAVPVDVSNMDFTNFNTASYAEENAKVIPNTDIQVQKVTEANQADLTSKWAGYGKLGQTIGSSLDIGAVFSTKVSDPNVALVEDSTKFVAVQKAPDGSAVAVEIKKTDMQQSSTSGSAVPYTVTQVAKPTINADGSTSQSVSTSQGFVNPSTNTNTQTGSGGQTVSFTPSGLGSSSVAGTTSSTGSTGTINLSGVTSRLDTISNQLTKLNQTFEDTEDSDSPLVATEHTIPTDTSAGDWDSETMTNLKNSIDNVVGRVEEFKTFLQNGFSLNLTGGSVTTCPYTKQFSFNGHTEDVTIDLCQFTSTLRPVFYTFLYLLFVLNIIIFSFKSILRLV